MGCYTRLVTTARRPAKGRAPAKGKTAAVDPLAPRAEVDAFDMIAAGTGATRARVIEEWTERAAIRQYLGNMSPAEAERLALVDVELLLLNQPSLF